MWGVSESREPIKGEFTKKLIEEVVKIREQKMKKTTSQMKNLMKK